MKNPKFLGVTYDNLFSFNQHTSILKSKLQSRNNILKCLSGTSWGKEKEVITSTYKAIGHALITYCCPIWTPSMSVTNWGSLQAAQNSALRIATGCHLMSDVNHLHAETKIMPVKAHCEMISKQFLLATQKTNHPNRVRLDVPPPPRQMKKTLVSEYGNEIKDMTYPDLPDNVYKQKLKHIHTKSVKEIITTNKILNTVPPEINKSEKTLPRKTRTTLAQLRSGYSNYLNSYKHRINPEIEDKCPHCQGPHTTLHLFECPNNPTTLVVLSDSVYSFRILHYHIHNLHGQNLFLLFQLLVYQRPYLQHKVYHLGQHYRMHKCKVVGRVKVYLSVHV